MNMNAAFDFSIRRDRLHEQVARQIQQLVIGESLRPGDRLPSERSLAERLGVSRTVIREALRVLSAQRLLEVRPGSGTYIRELRPNDATAAIDLYLNLHQTGDRYQDLNEVRRTLEIEIAGLAAERATQAEIAALKATVEEIQAHVEHAEAFTRADLAFHERLAQATHNELYSVLLAPIAGLLLEFRLMGYQYDQRASVEGALAFHRLILERIEARDVQGAREAMREHLEQAQAVIEAACADDAV